MKTKMKTKDEIMKEYSNKKTNDTSILRVTTYSLEAILEVILDIRDILNKKQ